GSTFAPPPHRFEAGTPPIAQAVGLAAAARYLTALGMDQVAAHEHLITAYALDGLSTVPGLRILGPSTATDRGGAISFTMQTTGGEQIHPHDVSQLLDARGIAVRGGHHCARPLHERFGVQSSTRASSYLYTKTSEIDVLVDALNHTVGFFSRPARSSRGAR
ncbi:MAG TPA: aminotransferase class V-fold PLP-dependent enzyme, partial [Friedmanniella sp.]